MKEEPRSLALRAWPARLGWRGGGQAKKEKIEMKIHQGHVRDGGGGGSARRRAAPIFLGPLRSARARVEIGDRPL